MEHLAHKIPWNTLSSSIIILNDGKRTIKIDDKKCKYFCVAFVKTLDEFALSYPKHYFDEKEYDLKTWNDLLHGIGGHLGLMESCVTGYIMLNLLCNDEKFKTIITPTSWSIQCCRGQYDGGHPSWIANKLSKMIKSNTFSFGPNEMRDYLKCLFRVLTINHIITEKITPEDVFEDIKWFLGLS